MSDVSNAKNIFGLTMEEQTNVLDLKWYLLVS